jgi:hypothetical protein
MLLLADYGVATIYEELGDALWVEQLREAVLEARRGAAIADALRSMLYIIAIDSILWTMVGVERGAMRKALVALIAIIVVADLVGVDKRYLGEDKWQKGTPMEMTPSPADREIMADKELGYRVYNLSVSPFNDATTSMFHRSIGGYHGAKMGRYQDLIDTYLNKGNDEVLDMLNTKYIIGPQGGVVERPTANGAAWFVQKIEVAESAADELSMLGSTDLKTTAIVNADAPKTAIEGLGEIELTEYRPNRLLYNYTLTGGSGVAIFSEIYYDKGWQAYVDGTPCDSFRADYLLRAMVLPEGTHTVEWRFRAPNWSLATTITLICSILIIFAVVITVICNYYGFNKEKKHIA